MKAHTSSKLARFNGQNTEAFSFLPKWVKFQRKIPLMHEPMSLKSQFAENVIHIHALQPEHTISCPIEKQQLTGSSRANANWNRKLISFANGFSSWKHQWISPLKSVFYLNEFLSSLDVNINAFTNRSTYQKMENVPRDGKCAKCDPPLCLTRAYEVKWRENVSKKFALKKELKKKNIGIGSFSRYIDWKFVFYFCCCCC